MLVQQRLLNRVLIKATTQYPLKIPIYPAYTLTLLVIFGASEREAKFFNAVILTFY
jgi:hypothetical protein